MLRPAINLLLFCLVLCACVHADTEIRNFRVPDEHAAPATPPGALVHLHSQTPTTLKLNSSSPELWVHVPLDDGAWTARLSWPASMPTRFGLNVYPWSGQAEAAVGSSHGALLHITAQALSPRIRHHLLHRLGFAVKPAEVRPDEEFDTTFHLLVEPLYLGVLPATAVSAIAGIGVMIALAAVSAPLLWRRVVAESRGPGLGDKNK